MKKFFFICSLLAVFTTQAWSGSTTIAHYPRNAMFIEHQPLFSPDGSRIALQARSGKNLRGYIAHIWIGNSRNGNFIKKLSRPVGHVTWISDFGIIYQDRSVRDALLIRAVNIDTGEINDLYRRNLKKSGYSTETVNLHKISNTGRYFLMSDRNGFYMNDITDMSSISLRGFSYKFYRNNTGVAFNMNDTALLVKDDSGTGYDLYAVSRSGLRKEKTIDLSSVLGPRKTLTNYFHFDRTGNRFAFAVEHCQGGCRLLTYTYDIRSGRTSSTGTIQGNQVLSVNWNWDLSKVVYNDFHQKLVVADTE